MVAADDDRRAQLAACDHRVEARAEAGALAVAQPADPRGQALEGDPLASVLDPARERRVVGELVQHGSVGRGDVGGIARQRDPAKRALALAEQRTHVRGHEARVGERPLEAAEQRLGAQRVAVVEDLGAGVEEPDHRGAVRGDRGARAADVLGRVGVAQLARLSQRHPVRDVARERVVRARLVGDDVRGEAHAQKARQRVGGVRAQPDAHRAPRRAGRLRARDGVVERVRDLVEIARRDAPLDASRVDLDAQRNAAVHRHRERLRATHAAEPAVSVTVPASEPPWRRRAISAKHS